MDEQDYAAIAANIRKYRILHHLTQEQMAVKLDIDTQYYAQLEQGKRRFTIEKIVNSCRVLDVNINEIVPAIKSDAKNEGSRKQAIDRIGDAIADAPLNKLVLIEKLVECVLK